MARRHPLGFYKDVAIYADTFGDTEFDRDAPVAGVVRIIQQYGIDQAILEDQARDILDRKYRADEQPGMFDLERTVALGDRGRIKRRSMLPDHLNRRKATIDKNQIAQNRAWADETQWIADCLTQLATKPHGSTVGDL